MRAMPGARARGAPQPDVENDVEGGSTPTTSAPQVAGGRPYWGQHWGVTRRQCLDLLRTLRADPAWDREGNVYAMVAKVIKPRTAGTGLGYALLVNGGEPLEVNLMVSHAWSENAEDFLETLARTASDRDVMFICALSLYQNEDGAGPSIAEQLGSDPDDSPFAAVLRGIRRRGDRAGWSWRWRSSVLRLPHILGWLGALCLLLPVLTHGCVPSRSECATWWMWEFRWNVLSARIGGPLLGRTSDFMMPGWIRLALPIAICFAVSSALTALALWISPPIYHGRMVAVPNREGDLYSRLWCVYEMFAARARGVPVEMARTLASAGVCKAEHATCSSTQDTQRIRGEIEGAGRGRRGYAEIDAAVASITRRARGAVVSLLMEYLARPVVAAVAVARLLNTPDGPLRDLTFGTDILPGFFSSATFASGFCWSTTVAAFLVAFWMLFQMTVRLLITYWLVKPSQGKPPLCRTFLFFMGSSIVFALVALARCISPPDPVQPGVCPTTRLVAQAVSFAFVGLPAITVAIPLLALIITRILFKCSPQCCRILGWTCFLAFGAVLTRFGWTVYKSENLSGVGKGAVFWYPHVVLWLCILNVAEQGFVAKWRWMRCWGISL